MAVERCDECGFDGAEWTDSRALDAIAELPGRWKTALSNIDPVDAQRRPIPGMWSILEYADHVREVLFGMRFVLDSAVAQPGVDLGETPEPRFEQTPRDVDHGAALEGIAREAESLLHRLRKLSHHEWERRAIIGDDEVDGHWICRHAVHDARHHLMDVERLRVAPGGDRSCVPERLGVGADGVDDGMMGRP